MLPAIKKKKDIEPKFFRLETENSMWYREAIAALRSNTLAEWPYFPKWQKEWIIAITEDDRDIQNAMAG